MAKSKVHKEDPKLAKELEADMEHEAMEAGDLPVSAPVATSVAVAVDSDVKKPKLTGSTEKKKPEFEQPGTNNQSRTVEE